MANGMKKWCMAEGRNKMPVSVLVIASIRIIKIQPEGLNDPPLPKLNMMSMPVVLTGMNKLHIVPLLT